MDIEPRRRLNVVEVELHCGDLGEIDAVMTVSWVFCEGQYRVDTVKVVLGMDDGDDLLDVTDRLSQPTIDKLIQTYITDN